MCGRFNLHTPTHQWVTALLPGISPDLFPELAPRYNIAPTQTIPVVRAAESAGREFQRMRWGLVPSWAKEPAIGSRMINARSETAHEKPSFRRALASRRCLIPADGYYEWRTEGRRKFPFHCYPAAARRPDADPAQRLLVFAGLWEQNRHLQPDGSPRDPNDPTGELLTCTILTTAAEGTPATIHHRMPVMLDPAAWDRWLSDDSDGKQVLDWVLQHGQAREFQIDPLDTYVNHAAHEGPTCLTPRLNPADPTPP